MVIVLVYWKIKKGHEEAFKAKWKSSQVVDDRSGLVGEFLSQPSGHEKYNWITWDLRGADGYTPFINVAMWSSGEEFHNQIGKYFKPEKAKEDFEFEIRTRALLTPECWRMGDWALPFHDSGGVL